MPIRLTLDMLPAGFAASNSRGGEPVKVFTRGFVSSEDGDRLIEHLEYAYVSLFSKVPIEKRPRQSQIDHLLALVHKDRTVTLYINELSIYLLSRFRKEKEIGQPVDRDDIDEVEEVRFSDVDIPDDVGVYFIFSFGWRKALFYDLTTLHQNSEGLRNYNINKLLGRYYEYLMFQDLLKTSEEDVWKEFFVQGWFSFISLSSLVRRKMIKSIEAGWKIDDLLPEITGEVENSLDSWLEKWAKRKCYEKHIAFLKKAKERYIDSDHLSVIHILYPQIEGILRDHPESKRPERRASQKELIETAMKASLSEDSQRKVLLPDKFERYLSEVYFKNFDPAQPEGVSRNTVAHGVAPVEDFSEKATVIGFLILDHLFYFLEE